MFSKYLLFSLFCCSVFSVIAKKDHSLLIGKLKTEENPYQVTVFDHSMISGNNKNKRDLVAALGASLPTVIVDLASNESSRSLSLKVHENPRATQMVYLMLQDKLDVEQAKSTIDVIVKLAPVPTRPKCILVDFDQEPTDQQYEQIFEYAWALKFLELAILQAEHHAYVSYNPFLKEVSRSQLSSVRKLFPDKLRNIHKYPILLAYGNDPPYFYKKNSYPASEKALIGSNFGKPIELFIDQINGSKNFVEMEEFRHHDSKPFFGNISTGKINAALLPLASSYMYGKPVVISKFHLASGIHLIVPLLSRSKLHFPGDLMAGLIYSLVIIMSFKLAMKALKVSMKDWSVLEVVQIFLGVPLTRPVDNLAERIVYLSVVLMSMKVSSDLIASLTEVKVLKQDVSLNNFEDCHRFGVPIYTIQYLKDSLLSNETNEMFEHFILKASMIECYEANEREAPTACIGGIYNTILSLQRHPKVRMRIVDPPFYVDFVGYAFETASPYVDKFNQFLTGLIEGGLFERFIPKRKKQELSMQELLISESSIAAILLIVLTIGHSLALVVFAIEIYFHRYKSLFLNRIHELLLHTL